MSKGKLIVIDGGDGSGKTEQTRLLVERMRQEGLTVGTLSFPRYETPTGKVVRAYLDGAFGPAATLHAHQASILYAVDRWASFMEGDFDGLARGEHLIANRYVASNMGHQGSKIDSAVDRNVFFKWNDDLEHGFYGIPRPDLNLILHVPAETSVQLIEGRGVVADGHENLPHLKRAEATYLELARSFPNFRLIECVVEDRLLAIDEIHELVWAEVRKVLMLQPA
jgi:dTMP kinase